MPQTKKKKITQITKKTPQGKILELSKIDCDGCTHCCEYGSGIILKDEIPIIAKKLSMKPDEFKARYVDEFQNFSTTHYKFKVIKDEKSKKPYGKCVFLKDKGCEIHEIKPLHCRVGTCNEYGEDINLWFTVNNFVNPYNPDSVRQWSTYIKLGNKTISGSELKELVPDKKKLKEMLSYDMLR